MAYAPDPGGRFASNVHRRVTASLTTPDEDVAFAPDRLFVRMIDDRGTDFANQDELVAVLGDLEEDGLVEQPEHGLYRMTHAGFELLTGPIADEPAPVNDEFETIPARLDGPTPLSSSVSVGGEGGDVDAG